MKKILLGITMLSAISYATGGSDTGDLNLQINTKATVVASGLMIASNYEGAGVALTELSIDHGNINLISGSKDNYTKTSNTFHIRRATEGEQLGRAGHTLTVTLEHDGEMKHTTYEADQTAVINHNLTVSFPSNRIENITSDFTDNNVSYSKSTKLTPADKNISGEIISTIAKNQNYALVGEYSNTATLKVKISKE